MFGELSLGAPKWNKLIKADALRFQTICPTPTMHMYAQEVHYVADCPLRTLSIEESTAKAAT